MNSYQEEPLTEEGIEEIVDMIKSLSWRKAPHQKCPSEHVFTQKQVEIQNELSIVKDCLAVSQHELSQVQYKLAQSEQKWAGLEVKLNSLIVNVQLKEHEVHELRTALDEEKSARQAAEIRLNNKSVEEMLIKNKGNEMPANTVQIGDTATIEHGQLPQSVCTPGHLIGKDDDDVVEISDPELPMVSSPHTLPTTSTAETRVKHKMDEAKSMGGQFACVCGLLFRLRTHLIRHIKRQTFERRFACRDCTQKFFQYSHLKEHIRRVHKKEPQPGGKIGCTKCGKISTSWKEHAEHIKLTCPGKDSQNPAFAVRTKIKKQVKGTPAAIDIPKRNGKPKKMLHYHGMDVSKRKRKRGYHFCICGERLRSRSGLNSHIRYFTQEWKFPCEVCGKQFFTKYDIKRHFQRIHSSKEPEQFAGH